jgi:hypothetical protein
LTTFSDHGAQQQQQDNNGQYYTLPFNGTMPLQHEPLRRPSHSLFEALELEPPELDPLEQIENAHARIIREVFTILLNYFYLIYQFCWSSYCTTRDGRGGGMRKQKSKNDDSKIKHLNYFHLISITNKKNKFFMHRF